MPHPRPEPVHDPAAFAALEREVLELLWRHNPIYASLLGLERYDAFLPPISPDGRITDVNDATIKVTGVSRDRLIGTDFASYFIEPEKAREGYQQVLARGLVMDYPLTIRHSDGKQTDVLYNASVYRDVGGNVLGVFAAARDITAQKQASQYARSLIEASLDPLVTISPDGRITDVNDATIKVTGVSRERLIGTDFANYFTEPAKAREGYQQVLARGLVMDYPLTLRSHDGTLTDVLYNATVYRDVAGNVTGVFAAARDITAQRKAEAQVADQRTKELERLAELERFQRLTVGRELKKLGWTGSTGNLPAAYLTGYLAGKRAAAKGVTTAVLDLGRQHPTKGGRLFAVLKGLLDAGLQIPHDEGVLPDPERVQGAHLGGDAAERFRATKSKLEAG